MAVGDIISAARYNVLQGRIQAIMATPSSSGALGYNQGVFGTFASSQVAQQEVVTTTHMNNLYTDVTNARYHQIGNAFDPGAAGLFQVTDQDQITDALHTAYETVLLDVEADKYLLSTTFAETKVAGVNSVRPVSEAWGGAATPQTITHEFTVDFQNANHRKAFFNAGGEIRLDFSMQDLPAGGTANFAKSQDWKNLLEDIGLVKFKYNQTVSSAYEANPGDSQAGTGSAIGNYELTGSYQTVFNKTGGGAPVYSNNYMNIKAKENNSQSISFRIDLQDDANVGADEVVEGTITSVVIQHRAIGVHVDVPTAAYTNNQTFDQATAPIPTTSAATCIGVCDESSSQTDAGMASKWTNFRSAWPNRPFYLLAPGGASVGDLRVPSAFTSDSIATGPVTVSRDNGDAGSASDWFAICGLNSLSPGSTVAYSIDNSGSMKTSTVSASIALLQSLCAQNQINLVEVAMRSEDWISPFDRTI